MKKLLLLLLLLFIPLIFISCNQKKQEMDKQLLKDLVETAKADKYNWDVIMPKFPELADVDLQLLKDYAETAKQRNYDYDVINPLFPELFPDEPLKKSNSIISEGKPLDNQEIKKELTASDIYNSSKAKVVLLMTYDNSYIPVSQGSGFFINKNTLVTNYHVIEGSHSVELKLIGEDDFIRGAKIISASKKHDIAIIETKEDYSFFEIDSLNTESIGSKIYTIGNPRGLEGTISEGIISAKRKKDYDLIQITAPISPGNSGGPLINEKGDVIGVSTFTMLNSQNINFAVPIKYINEVTKYVKTVKTKKNKKLKDKKAISLSKFMKNGPEFYEFPTFKNHTSSFIKSITGIIIYKDLNGEIIDYRTINVSVSIPPKLSKRLKLNSFDQDQNYKYYNSRGYSYPKFKVEFRLLSYEIE